MSFITYFKLAVQLIPIIHEAVTQVEALFPEGGNGKKKLAMVRSTLEKAHAIANTGTSFAELWPVVDVLITHTVNRTK